MAHVLLSDSIDITYPEVEHETFVHLGEAIEDLLASRPEAMNEPFDAALDATHEFDDESYECLMGICSGPCLI